MSSLIPITVTSGGVTQTRNIPAYVYLMAVVNTYAEHDPNYDYHLDRNVEVVPQKINGYYRESDLPIGIRPAKYPSYEYRTVSHP